MAARGEPGDAACGEALSAGPRRFRSRSSPAMQSLLICASQSCCSQPSFIGVTVALDNCASPGSEPTDMGETMVERQYRIHPAVGVARVGDAERSTNDFFFVGPEAPGVPPNFDSQSGSFNSFKLDGRVRPQAARFRIFEYEKGADGKFHPKGEGALGDGRTTKITWTVHLANRNASFCQSAGRRAPLPAPCSRNTPPSKCAPPPLSGRTTVGARLTWIRDRARSKEARGRRRTSRSIVRR